MVLATGVNALTYMATGLTAGLTYSFKVEARNTYGYSSYSDVAVILCATSPARPAAPTTEIQDDNVILTWAKPSENGTPITHYTVLIEQADSTFSTELTSCDGTDDTVVAATQCTIPLSVLQQAPYSLSTLGVAINAKVSATNAYGTS